jgi:RNA polymerase sigma factor (sigma-70 family)
VHAPARRPGARVSTTIVAAAAWTGSMTSKANTARVAICGSFASRSGAPILMPLRESGRAWFAHSADRMTAVAPDDPQPAPPQARLETLIRDYGALIKRVVARAAGIEAQNARDDIEQQVLINLWRQLEREQTIEYPASYIYTAAVRETVRAVRRARAREQPAGDAIDLAGEIATQHTPETELRYRERLDAVRAALDALAPERKQAVQAHLAGYEVAEIQRLFGWPYQKARNLVSRGMIDLRTILIERGIRG